MNTENIRNIAIIAHVDHGKTTLVDAMLKQSGTFRDNEAVEDRVMDSNDLEKERGITILAKNTSLIYKDVKVNIVDTPGHADFGGEVERSLSMVDGVLLLIDAFEGCMPQTRFVLQKALALNLKPIIVVNKVDRPNARPHEVVDEILELFMDLDATDEQLDSPIVFASGKAGWASLTPEMDKPDLSVLFDKILEEIPAPTLNADGSLQMMVSNIDFDNFTGRIAIGRINRGVVCNKDTVVVCGHNGTNKNCKISALYEYKGLNRVPCDEATAGDVVAISGLDDINIGDTVCAVDNPDPLPFVKIDQPVLSMNFSVNNGPFAGREGQFVTSRQIRDRLMRELQSNISLKVEDTDSADTLKVSGRGELHLSVLIENMRRQGYEFMVSKPSVILKEIDGVICEPFEILYVDVPNDYTGAVIEKISQRKGEMLDMAPTTQDFTRITFSIPSRGLIGYRSELLTDTKGAGVMNTLFDGYKPSKGEITSRTRGSLVAWETGESVTYGLFNAQERGDLFIGAGVKVYEGMIVGVNNKQGDIAVNVCKKKQLTNMRASGSDDALRLIPPTIMSLEKCLEFIEDDELLEVTPMNLRMRKKILDTDLRAKADAAAKKNRGN